MTHATQRDALLALGIVRLTAAARAVGFSWKNGALNKEGIADALIANGLDARALEWAAGKKDSAPESTPAPVPFAPPGSPDFAPGWKPRPEFKPAPEVTPEPSPAPEAAPAAGDPAEALRAALQALLGRPSVDESAVRRIIGEELRKVEGLGGTSLTITLPDLGEKKIPGAHVQFAELLQLASIARMDATRTKNIMLVGPAGSGKTSAAEAVAKTLEVPFFSIPPALLNSDLLGYMDAQGNYVPSTFRKAYETPGAIILMDEMDSYSPEALLASNSALANGFCAFPDGIAHRAPGVVVIAGCNTDGSGASMQYSGRARIDGATLDRFVMVEWGYDPKVETALSAGHADWLAAVRAVRKFAEDRGILDVVGTTRAIAYGAELLSANLSRTRVLQMTLRRGALREVWKDVLNLSPVVSFLTRF